MAIVWQLMQIQFIICKKLVINIREKKVFFFRFLILVCLIFTQITIFWLYSIHKTFQSSQEDIIFPIDCVLPIVIGIFHRLFYEFKK